jgi:hypothetical protein
MLAPPPVDLSVIEQGTTLARAHVTTSGDCVQLSVHIGAGHLPASVRPELLRRVFALPEVAGHHALRASIPTGDAELLLALQERCVSITTRVAGATCLVDALIS